MTAATCADCGEPAIDPWPSKAGGDLCQMCWERECSESWWAAVKSLCGPEPSKDRETPDSPLTPSAPL